MNKQILALLVGASAALAYLPAHAADTTAMGADAASAPMSRADYKTHKNKVAADYKMAKKDCEVKKGADERACMKEAKASHEMAEKDLKAMRH